MVFFLKNKYDVLSIFNFFIKFAQQFFNPKIILVQINAGGEFITLVPMCKTLGINYCFSCFHTHQQNRLAEHKYQHIVEIMLALLARASLPFTFWANTFETATYLNNLLSTPMLHNQSLYFMVYHKLSNYLFLKVLVVNVGLTYDLTIVTN